MIIKSMAQQDTISHPSTSVNGYLQFVRSEKIPLLYNSKQPINVFDAIIDVDDHQLSEEDAIYAPKAKVRQLVALLYLSDKSVRRISSIAFANLLVFVTFRPMMIDYNGLKNTRTKRIYEKV